jgi:hypothetical protein
LKGDGAGGYQQDPQQGPEYPGHGPAPSQNQDSGDDSGDPSIMDTERLARFFQVHKNHNVVRINDSVKVKDTGIRFTPNPRNVSPTYSPEYSRIARFIHMRYPGQIFDNTAPQHTYISNEFIQGIRDINQNVPNDFR